jgi:uncharacterized protein (DUF952 family)
MIYHLVALSDWQAEPDRPYAPASLADEGFVHCSPDEPVTLAVANGFYRDLGGPVVVLLIDEAALTSQVRAEPPMPVPPPGVDADTLFPHIFGPIDRGAVVGLLDAQRDAAGAYTALTERP